MAQQTREVLKDYFKTGDKPTQGNFEDLIDSFPLVGEVQSKENTVDLDTEQKITAAKTFSGGISMNNTKILKVATPANLTDAANKQYIDTKIDDIPIEKGTGVNSVVQKGGNNKVISDGGVATGKNNTVGLKAYPYNYIDTLTKSIFLSLENTELLDTTPSINPTFSHPFEVGDRYSIHCGNNYYNFGTITEVNGNKITVDALPTDMPSHDDKKRYFFYVFEKADKGIIDLGQNSAAQGFNNYTYNECAYAEGKENKSFGKYSHTEGKQNEAYYCAHVEGSNNVAKGNTSHAEGTDNVAMNSNAHVEGRYTKAKGYAAHAEGLGISREIPNLAIGEASHVEGKQTTASGNYSHSEGEKTKSEGQSSHAEGLQTIAEGQSSHAEGRYTYAKGVQSHAEGLGRAGDTSIGALGSYSHSEGKYTTASGAKSHAEGTETIASNDSSHAEGRYTKASNDSSHAEGRYTKATGYAAHAEGYGESLDNPNLAQGDYSHVEGEKNKALGIAAHSEGGSTVATGKFSHSEGRFTRAHGLWSHVEGGSVEGDEDNYGAFGPISHCEGYATRTFSGANSAHVEGRFTEASNMAEHACGIYNKSIKSSDASQATHFSIGIGTANTNRKNAVEVKQNGDTYSIGIGGYDGTNSQTDGIKTVQEVVEEVDIKVASLEAKNTELTNTITSLESRIAELEQKLNEITQTE